MRLRSRPVLFARLFVDAVTTRPFLRELLEQRRAGEPLEIEAELRDGGPPALPRAA
jgi:hypothetical protein